MSEQQPEAGQPDEPTPVSGSGELHEDPDQPVAGTDADHRHGDRPEPQP